MVEKNTQINSFGSGGISIGGNISGTVISTNNTIGISGDRIAGNKVIGQAVRTLRESDDRIARELADLIEQLQSAIENSSLSDDDKAEALEQVKSIAEAGKTPQDNAMQKVVKTAMKVIKGTIADLPATEDLAKVVIKVGPIIAALFGFGA